MQRIIVKALFLSIAVIHKHYILLSPSAATTYQILSESIHRVHSKIFGNPAIEASLIWIIGVADICQERR
jgi:hypothetical protein